nr:HNH endonuclease signature motif containing protein [Allomuricauda sp.]
MPNRPKKKKRPWRDERKPFQRRAKDNQGFYNSARWRKVARAHKARNPFCVKCLAEGKVTAVEFTDHIKRIEDGGKKYADSNLQSLCKFHHNQKSGREAHGYRENNN